MNGRDLEFGRDYFAAGRFTAWLYDSYRYVTLIQVAIVVSCGAFVIKCNKEILALPWRAFWYDGWNVAVSLSGVVFVCGIVPWVIIPACFGWRDRPDSVKIRDRHIWTNRRKALIFQTLVTGPVTAYIAGPVVVRLWLNQMVEGFGAIALACTVGALAPHLVKRAWRPRPVSGDAAGLADLPDSLRPQQSDVLNLNVGSLAPRLRIVNRGIIAWNEYVDRYGATSQHVAAALAPELPTDAPRTDRDFTMERYGWLGVENLRDQLAGRVHTTAGRLVFFPSTTRATWAALDALEPEVCLVTDAEHPGQLHLAARLRRRRRTTVRFFGLRQMLLEGTDREKIAAAIADAAATSSADVLLLSHVIFSNGIVLPIHDIVRRVRDAIPECRVVIDGAHAVGQEHVDIVEIDADYYAFSGHKWLYGPAALGGLVAGPRVGEEQLKVLDSEVYESLAFNTTRSLREGSSVALEPFVGLACSLNAIAASGGERVVQGNLARLRALFEDEIAQSHHVRPCTIDRWRSVAGILNVQHKSVPLDHRELVNTQTVLENDNGVVVRVVDFPASLRICLPFYLTAANVVASVRHLDAVIGRRGNR